MKNNCESESGMFASIPEKLDKENLFAAMIAHEMRNTLTTIKGVVKLIQKGEGDDLYFQLAESEIERAEDFLTGLLTLSSPQKAEYSPLDICRLLDQVISLLYQQAEANGVEIIQKFDADLPPLYGNENQLKQAFINFLKNGIEAMPEGGRFLIEAVSQEQELLVRFTDTGGGMPNEMISKIGHPFFTTKEGGTGLGMMVSRNIIEKHHGRLSISSEENKGTTIEVKFYIRQESTLKN